MERAGGGVPWFWARRWRVALVWRAASKRHPHPLVRLGIFRLRTLSAANGVTLLFGAWNAGELVVLALSLQRAVGYSPLAAGFALVPQGLGGLTAGLLGARFADRFGIKRAFSRRLRSPRPVTCCCPGRR
jgi:hypothetical protein